MNQHAAQCRHLLSQAARLLADLEDEHRAFEPQPGLKTAGWLVGHLAFTGDFARHLCGRQRMAPKAWGASFAPGTLPSHDPLQYPPMAELQTTCIRVYEDLCDAALTVDPDALKAANPFTPAARLFATAGDFAAYLMTSHFAYHLGQLQAWRASAGILPVKPAASTT
jgi:hypothetical protein